MLPKTRRFHLIYLFYAIILLVPLLWLFRLQPVGIKSELENRNKAAFPVLKLKSLWADWQNEGNGLPVQIQRAASDQFPGRLNLILLAKRIDRLAISTAYALLPDKAIPAERRGDIYIMRDHSFLVQRPDPYNPDLQHDIDLRIENYQYMIDHYPEINFQVFFINTLKASSLHPANRYFWDADAGRCLDYFETNKPEKLAFSKLELESIEDHVSWFYRTDHHWNVNGVLEGYAIIHAMLKEHYPEISPMLAPARLITFEDIEFRGSHARTAFYTEMADPLTVEDVTFPAFTIYEDGHKTTYNRRDAYLAGSYTNIPFEGHYGAFYGGDEGMLEYVVENDSHRNLLILGSSFTNAIEPLLASHYAHTYAVDFRHYGEFSFAEFIKEHPVDDVLMIGDCSVAAKTLGWEILD